MTRRLGSIALLCLCGACTDPAQPDPLLGRSFLATLRTVDTVDGPPFRTTDIACSGHRSISELLYDSLSFGAQGHVERRRATRLGSADDPDTVVAWAAPVESNQTGDYQVEANTVTAYWPCPGGCGRDNPQTFQRADSTALVVEGAVGGACFVNGQIVNSTARDVPFRYRVTHVAVEGVRPN